MSDECQGDRQQGPRHDIVDSRAQDGGRSQGRTLYVSFLEHAGQHREGRDAHGNAEKKNEWNAADTMRRESDSQRVRQKRSHGEWKYDAHSTRHDGSGAMLIELFVIQFHSDQEQEQNEANGAKNVESTEGCSGK